MRVRSGFVGAVLVCATAVAWGQPASLEQRQAVAANVRALGWAPYSAELNLVDNLPRPPRLAPAEELKGCEPTAAAFSSPKAETAWKKRRPARVLTIWGVAHYGARAASKGEAGLCQDLVFLSRQWQATLGQPVTGKLAEKDVNELARAISDAESGRHSDFGNLPVGIDPTHRPVAMASAGPRPKADAALATLPGRPDHGGDVDTRVPLALAEKLAAAITEDAAKPDGGRIEATLQSSLYYLPVVWLVFDGDTWNSASREEKRDLLVYLRQYLARLLRGIDAASERGGKAITISLPEVFAPGAGDERKPARRLAALCSYAHIRNRCHSVRIPLALGAGAREPEVVLEMIPAPDREPGYQVVNVDILGISIVDTLNTQLRGKSTAETLALMKRAASPKQSGG